MVIKIPSPTEVATRPESIEGRDMEVLAEEKLAMHDEEWKRLQYRMRSIEERGREELKF